MAEAAFEPVSLDEVLAPSPPAAARASPSTIESLVVRIAKEQGVDPSLALRVARQESRFNPDAISSQGARGVMQLMPDTWKRFGVNDPHDPVENITGGVKYLAQLNKQFGGDEEKVRAAYHSGEDLIEKKGLEGLGPKGRDYVQKTADNRGAQIASERKGKFEPVSIDQVIAQPKATGFEPVSLEQVLGLPAEEKKQVQPARGAAGEIFEGGKRGAFGQFPQMIGQAFKWMGEEPKPLEQGGRGSTLHEIGQSLENAGTDYLDNPEHKANPEAHNWLTNALASGAAMVVPSVAPLAVAALLPETLPGWVALGLGATSMSWLYGGSQAQQTYERGIKAGLSPDKARAAGIQTGAIEAGGEIVGTMALGYLFGTVGKAIGRAAGMDAVDGVFEAVKNPSYFKAFAKKLPAVYGTEIGTEMAQNAGEAAVEQAHGIPQGEQGTPWEQAKQAIAPTFGMTTLLLPFGLVGHGMQARQSTVAAGALQDPSAPKEVRTAAAEAIGAALKSEDKAFAEQWTAKAKEAIAAGAPVGLDRQFAQGQPDAGAAPASGPKQPWQMTREEFEADARFQGVHGKTDESKPSYWFTSDPAEAKMWAEREGPGGRVDVVFKSQLGTDEQPSGRNDFPDSKHTYTGKEKNRPVVASIPVEATADPHRYLVEQAVKNGKPVPAEVLAQYPDLAKIAAAQAPGAATSGNGPPPSATPDAAPLSPIDQARADAQVLKGGGDLPGADETRTKNATLLAVYGENAAVRHVIDGGGQFSAIGDAMLMAAPTVERVRGTIKAGTERRDITNDILGAVDELARIKSSGQSIATVMATGIAHDISYEGQQLMQFLDENAGNSKRIASFLEAYLHEVETATGVPSEVRGRAFDIVEEQRLARKKAEEKVTFEAMEKIERGKKEAETAKAAEQKQDQNLETELIKAKASGGGIQPGHQTAMEIAFANAKKLKTKEKKNAKPGAGSPAEVQAGAAGNPAPGNRQDAGKPKNDAGTVPVARQADRGGDTRPVRSAGDLGGAEKGGRGAQIIAERKSASDIGTGERTNPVQASTPKHVATAAARAEPLPSPAQIEADNARKGHFEFAEGNPLRSLGMVSIETAKGVKRVSKDGKWTSPPMVAHYGHLQIAKGADGDKADITVGDDLAAKNVYVIDQIDPTTGKFDETKSFAGFPSEKAARAAYLASFSDDAAKRIGAVTAMPAEQFVQLARSNNLDKPVAYKEVIPEPAGSILSADEIPSDMKITLAVDGSEETVDLNARKAFKAASRKVNRLTSLLDCLRAS